MRCFLCYRKISFSKRELCWSWVWATAVCITDKASMVFGGSDDPLALGCVYSLGEFINDPQVHVP